MKKKQPILLLTISALCYFFTGSIVTTTGVLLGPIGKSFGIRLGSMGYVFTFLNFGIFLTLALGGVLIRRISLKKLLAGSALLSIITIVFLSFDASMSVYSVVIFVIGAASGVFMAVGSYLIVRLYSDPKLRSSKLIMVDFFFSFAGIVMPMLFGFLLGAHIQWIALYYIIALLSLVIILLVLKAKFPGLLRAKLPDEKTPAHEKWNMAVYVVGFSAFAFILAELILSAWLPTYLERTMDFSISRAAMFVTMYWLAKAVGLFVNQYTVKKMPLRVYLLFSVLLGCVFVAVLANVRIPLVIMGALLIFGFLNSGIYASMISYASLQFLNPSPFLAPFVLTCGTVGTFLSTFVSGFVDIHFGVAWAINSVTAAYGLSAIALVLAVIISRAEKIHRPFAVQNTK
jgi:MFS transporter, TsgA protein